MTQEISDVMFEKKSKIISAREKKSEPWLSVIIPIYNAEKYLNKCLDTIRIQTFSDYEVIMVDDGSTDRSSDICREYANIDSRFTYISKKNGGPFQTRIHGTNQARGKYFTFCDADDYYANKYVFKKVYEKVNNYECSVLQFGFINKYNHLFKKYRIVKQVIVHDKKEFQELDYPKLLCSFWDFSHLTTNTCNKVYCRKLIDSLPDSATADRIFWGEDLILNLHLFRECKRICFIPDALYCYRQSSGGTNKFSLTTMHDLDTIKRYQMQFLKEYQGESKDKIENIMFSELAGWFYYYLLDARKHVNDSQVRKLITESLELPSFRIAREYYLQRNENSEFVNLLKSADVEEYMMKTKTSANKITVKDNILQIMKKIYKTI